MINMVIVTPITERTVGYKKNPCMEAGESLEPTVYRVIMTLSSPKSSSMSTIRDCG